MGPKLLFQIIAAIAILAVPILLTTSSLRFAINAGALYEYNFDQYQISSRTGINRDELSRIGSNIRDYFNDDTQYISINAEIYNEVRPLFTEREILHMEDVKSLIHGVYMLQLISLVGLIGLGGFSFLMRYKRSIYGISLTAASGSIITILIIAGLGVGSLFGFEALFLKFHQLGFANDLWQLNPRIHNLIAIFPESFFRDATIFVALITLGQALLVVGLSTTYIWFRKKKNQLLDG